MADSLGALGLVMFIQGNLAEAQGYLEEAVTIAATFHCQEMVALWQPLLALAQTLSGLCSRGSPPA